MRWKCVDANNRSGWLRVWGNIEGDVEYTTWLSEVKNDSGWGMSTNSGKVRQINAFD